MDFAELATSFAAEVLWSDAGKVRAPQSFTIHGDPAIVVFPEIEEGDCTAALFQLDRPGAAALPRVTLRAEDSLDRGGKLLGVNREVQLGDPAFDNAVYLDSEAPDAAVRQMFAAPAARVAAAALIAEVCSEVIVAGTRITARVPAELLAAPHRPAVRDALAELVRLQAALTPPTVADATIPPPRGVLHILVMSGVWLALAVVAMFVRSPPTLAWGPVWSALAIGAGLWIVCIVGLAAVLRGGTDSMRWLLIGGGFFLLVAPFAGMRLALLANTALDEAPATPQQHDVRALEVHGPTIKLEIADANDESITLALPRERGDPGLTTDATRVTLHTRPGALGWRWVERIGP